MRINFTWQLNKSLADNKSHVHTQSECMRQWNAFKLIAWIKFVTQNDFLAAKARWLKFSNKKVHVWAWWNFFILKTSVSQKVSECVPISSSHDVVACKKCKITQIMNLNGQSDDAISFCVYKKSRAFLTAHHPHHN
jgi:hypothetical protein